MTNKISLFFIFIIGSLTLSAQSPPADSIAAKQFDFWIGEWDVYKGSSDTLVGNSQIKGIIDGFGIQETYQSVSSPYQGTSLNKWNSANKRWEQYWIDNSGLTLHMEGSYQDGKMILGNSQNTPRGLLYNRVSWELLETNEVIQLWEQSYNGSTWTTVFNGRYVPKK